MRPHQQLLSIVAVCACSLKSGNVLLDKEYRAKLADVGLAKTLTHSLGCDNLATCMSTGELGTFAWAAPEVASLGFSSLMMPHRQLQGKQ